ncbi:hypothetical protein WOSG25_110550 [Weissella oryzae SG25]|uniref:Uncharacterized protein n=2 Tax=Weissella TaxID=46255 RepID=A0A069CW10_WEIOS|nr:hypothetical protein WOSG25_110550 [Weissella oryzae SG25]
MNNTQRLLNDFLENPPAFITLFIFIILQFIIYFYLEGTLEKKLFKNNLNIDTLKSFFTTCSILLIPSAFLSVNLLPDVSILPTSYNTGIPLQMLPFLY